MNIELIILFLQILISTSTGSTGKNILILQGNSTVLNSSSNLYANEILKCGVEVCPIETSICYIHQCLCDKFHSSLKDDFILCTYELKFVLVAILLEFFFPFGIGHFYALRYIYGYFKLFFFIFPFLVRYMMINNKTLFQINLKLLSNIMASALALLQIFDIVCFFLGIFKDGNGKDLINFNN
jgi:hypothetical protein